MFYLSKYDAVRAIDVVWELLDLPTTDLYSRHDAERD